MVSDNNSMVALGKQLAKLINQERNKRGLESLKIDPELTKWAMKKSHDMIAKKYFAHKSPTYGNVSEMLRNGGVNFNYAGENLAKSSSIINAHRGFMNSPVHRTAILNDGFTHIGIGLAYKGSTLYVTELFAAKNKMSSH